MLPQVVGEFRVGADPTLRFAPSGTAVCSMRAVASSRKKDEQTGEWKDDKTTWVDLVGFRKLAENMAESFQKGDLVTVTGKLQVEDWEDNEGAKRKSVSVIVDNIGVSIAFNPARTIKTERTQDSAPKQQQGGDPWATPAQGQQQQQNDEPPF
jgi:single-strand DNA-binding protein